MGEWGGCQSSFPTASCPTEWSEVPFGLYHLATSTILYQLQLRKLRLKTTQNNLGGSCRPHPPPSRTRHILTGGVGGSGGVGGGGLKGGSVFRGRLENALFVGDTVGLGNTVFLHLSMHLTDIY